jgi:hypothetical protein
MDITFSIARDVIRSGLGLISSILSRNMTGETKKKTQNHSGWFVFGQKLEFTESQAGVPALSGDARFYLCTIACKTEGWLLFGAIWNAVTSKFRNCLWLIS